MKLKTMTYGIVLALAVMCSFMSDIAAQQDTTIICEFKGDLVIFNLDRRWDADKRAEVVEKFDLDSIAIDKVLKSKDLTNIEFNNEYYLVSYPSEYRVRLTRKKTEMKGVLSKIGDLIFAPTVSHKYKSGPGFVNPDEVHFGYNRFTEPAVVQLSDNKVVFRLSGYATAQQVYLTGSFNGWEEKSIPMTLKAGIWEATIVLEPGKYLYKYIVDGRWMPDPANTLGEYDGFTENNSVLYVTNYVFELAEIQGKRKAILSGTFNNWDEQGAWMNRTDHGWRLPVYLKKGNYEYKYIVDGQWMLDPGNPHRKSNWEGGENSTIGIGDPTLFELKTHLDAQEVYLAGDFNGWREGDLRMTRTDTGWVLPYHLSDGNYAYKFIVDGEWILDPYNPFRVRRDGYDNSHIAVGATHVFLWIEKTDADEIIVTGDFTDWSEENYRMVKVKGKWVFPVFLHQGKHSYKFKVDGEWQIDPNNHLYEQNTYGTDNSILWIDGGKPL